MLHAWLLKESRVDLVSRKMHPLVKHNVALNAETTLRSACKVVVVVASTGTLPPPKPPAQAPGGPQSSMFVYSCPHQNLCAR